MLGDRRMTRVQTTALIIVCMVIAACGFWLHFVFIQAACS